MGLFLFTLYQVKVFKTRDSLQMRIALFPNLFKIIGSGPGMRVMKADPPARQTRPDRPASTARPVQEGGAGSSTDRAPRALEVDPRAPYRRFPNETRVEYKANPSRLGSVRYRRYELYKSAKTIGEARALGATSQDISMDVEKGALILL